MLNSVCVCAFFSIEERNGLIMEECMALMFFIE